MGRRISVYIDEDVLEALNAHTQASPLSRSELVAVALRRFLRDEHRRGPGASEEGAVARGVAAGDLPSSALDAHAIPARGAPWSN